MNRIPQLSWTQGCGSESGSDQKEKNRIRSFLKSQSGSEILKSGFGPDQHTLPIRIRNPAVKSMSMPELQMTENIAFPTISSVLNGDISSVWLLKLRLRIKGSRSKSLGLSNLKNMFNQILKKVKNTNMFYEDMLRFCQSQSGSVALLTALWSRCFGRIRIRSEQQDLRSP